MGSGWRYGHPSFTHEPREPQRVQETRQEDRSEGVNLSLLRLTLSPLSAVVTASGEGEIADWYRCREFNLQRKQRGSHSNTY